MKNIRKPSRIMTAYDFCNTGSTTIYWLSGAGFLINCHGTCILIDPVLMTASGDASRSESGLPLKVTLPLDPDLIPDRSIILYTHADADHLGPGTALALADSINEAMDNVYSYTYDRSQERKKRSDKEIGIAAVRGGTIVGEHEVIYAGEDEVIEFKHTAYSKAIFAK